MGNTINSILNEINDATHQKDLSNESNIYQGYRPVADQGIN